MKKFLLLSITLFIAEFSFADYEVYDGQTVSQDFSGQSMNYSSWKGADLSGSKFVGTKLKEADFSNVSGGTNFSNAILTDAVFENYKTKGTIFNGAKLTRANFSKAELDGSSFDNADLTNINFSDAKLWGASSFKNTNLTNANFENANLFRGNFVSFDNADLTNANFTNVMFCSVVQFSQYKDAYSAKFNITTFNGTNFTKATFAIGAVGNGANGNNGSACSAVDFSNKKFINVNFSNAIFAADYYNGQEPIVNFTNSIFQDCIFHGAIFGIKNKTKGVNFSDMNLSYMDFSEAKFYNVNLSNSDITRSNFSRAEGLTSSQLSQTINYKNKDMNGIKFDGLILTNWILRNQNLQNTSFIEANLSGVNARVSDLRGADLTDAIGLDTVKTQNTIWNDGIIKNFSMESSDDNFSIRKYEPVSVGGASISAKLNTSSSISGGAILTLEKGAEFEVVNNSTLTLSKYSEIVINTDLNSSTKFVIEEGSSFNFKDGAKLVINLEDFEWSEFNSETLKFSVMNWEDVSKIIGLEDLVKSEDIVLNVNGKEYSYSWGYEITDSGLLVVLPEPSTYAAIFGALALAFAAYRRRK